MEHTKSSGGKTSSTDAVEAKALIVDWGGVLTEPLDTAMSSWAEADGVDFSHFADVMRHWVGSRGPGPVMSGGAGDAGAATREPAGAAHLSPAEAARPTERELDELDAAAAHGLVPDSPVHALERGEIGVPEFERELAAALAHRGSPVPAEGLLGRLLGGLEQLRPDMIGLVRRARAAGIRTALLSNSWGDNYPEEEWEGAFDVVVISGRVGMRKPDAEIFHHAADLLGVEPRECVMVDDLAHNVRGAVAAGMVGVLYENYEQAAGELEILFGRPLR